MFNATLLIRKHDRADTLSPDGATVNRPRTGVNYVMQALVPPGRSQ
jgi:hypothetical protein